MSESSPRIWSAAVLALLLGLTCWAYWPGLTGPLLLDDAANLQALDALEESPEFSLDVIVGNGSGPTGRPVSMYSFVLERLLLGSDSWLQKRSNLYLHLFNAVLVFLLARILLVASRQELPELKALLVAAFWMTSPLLLSTVLYVVQRMAMLSACFSLLAMLCYCYARLHAGGLLARVSLYLLGITALVMGVFSKENAILTLPLLLAVELYIFRFEGLPVSWQRHAPGFARALPLLLLVVGVWLIWFTPEYVAQGYANRDFDLQQRLLTQCRLLWYSVAQLLVVDVHDLGVYHDDVVLSDGLFVPLQTLYAVIAWLVVLSLCCFSLLTGRLRLLAFGFSFYLLGHALESTVIGLEIYFEHRNYLPAFGLYFAVVSTGGQLGRRYPWLSGWLLLLALLLLFRAWLLLASQSNLWSDGRLLHLDAVNHHPRSERALIEAGLLYAELGALEAGLEFASRAASLSDTGPVTAQLQSVVLHCLANRPLPEDVLLDVSVADGELSLAAPADAMYVINRKVFNGDCPNVDARLLASRLMVLLDPAGKSLANPKLLSTMVLFENNLQQLAEALLYVEALLLREPESVLGLQFKLYLASTLERDVQREEALDGLRSLRDQGRLNVQEQYNLGLFDIPAAEVDVPL